jgi:hypothetical protein
MKLFLILTAVLQAVLITLSGCSPLTVTAVPDTVIQTPSITETTTITNTVTESWFTYTNSVYKYSIQYPIDWCFGISEGNNSVPELHSVVIASLKSAHVCVFTYPRAQSVYSFVDSIIEWGKKNMILFQVLSRSDVTWHGKYQACEWTFMYQLDTASPLIMERNLTLETDGYLHEVFGKGNYSEFESYSTVIDKIITSFRMI